jgi:A/G-specific adenine glycosylase
MTRSRGRVQPLPLTAMPKRTAALSEDEESVYAASVVDSGSDEYEPDDVPRPRRTVGRQSHGKSRRVAVKASEASTGSTVRTQHASARHSISSADAQTLVTALLAWYAGVHAARGMPWRKPFDRTWTTEERSQRAYEVSSITLNLCTRLTITSGLGI